MRKWFVMWNAKDWTYYLQNDKARESWYYWSMKDKNGRVWCYFATDTADYREVGEGHIRYALQDGWIPERTSLQAIREAAL